MNHLHLLRRVCYGNLCYLHRNCFGNRALSKVHSVDHLLPHHVLKGLQQNFPRVLSHQSIRPLCCLKAGHRVHHVRLRYLLLYLQAHWAVRRFYLRGQME